MAGFIVRNCLRQAEYFFTENLKRSSAGLRQDGRGSQNRAYERCDERGASACQNIRVDKSVFAFKIKNPSG